MSAGRRIRVRDGGVVLSGVSYLFRSHAAALKESRHVTANPRVAYFRSGAREWYAACGECWIDNEGRRGQYLYGRGGELLDLVEVA